MKTIGCGCGVPAPIIPTYPYRMEGHYACDCCQNMYQPNINEKLIPSSGAVKSNLFMIANNIPFLIDEYNYEYGTKMSVSENVRTSISNRRDLSCVNLTAKFDLTEDKITTNTSLFAFLQQVIQSQYETNQSVLDIIKPKFMFKVYFKVLDESNDVVYENHMTSYIDRIKFHYTDIKDYFLTSFHNVMVHNIPAMDYAGIYRLAITRVEVYVKYIKTAEHFVNEDGVEEFNPFYQFTENKTKIVTQHDTIHSTEGDEEIMLAARDITYVTPFQANITTRLKISFYAYMSGTIVSNDTYPVWSALFDSTGMNVKALEDRVRALETVVQHLINRCDTQDHYIHELQQKVEALEETSQTTMDFVHELDESVSVLNTQFNTLEENLIGTILDVVNGKSILVYEYGTSSVIYSSDSQSDVGSWIKAHTTTQCGVRFTTKISFTEIESNPFWNTPNLYEVIIDGPITTLGPGCFSSCSNLTKIVLPDTLQTIGQGALSSTSIEYLTIPGSVVTIDNSAVTGNVHLRNVTLNEGTKYLNTNCFAGSLLMTSITIPSTVETIDAAFVNCPHLETITVRKVEDSISGAPWGATNATVVWDP